MNSDSLDDKSDKNSNLIYTKLIDFKENVVVLCSSPPQPLCDSASVAKKD
jgi:hypothetical protein